MLPPSFGPFTVRGVFDASGLFGIHVVIAAAPENKGESTADFHDLYALVDTGASGIAVNPAFADTLGLQRLNLGGQFLTASEQTKGNESFAVVGVCDGKRWIARRFQVAIIDHLPLAGVIGMDLLADGVLKVDGPARTWSWSLLNRKSWAALVTQKKH